MKRILIVLFLLVLKPAFSLPDIIKVRDLFSKASEDETANNQLFEMTKGYTLDYAPRIYAYHAGAEMTLANHAIWPGTKLEYFYSGKDKLESAIKKFPKNVEIRYIRYCVQQGCPFFLNYSSNLEEDKKYVLSNLNLTDWSAEYKKKVTAFLN